MATAVWSLCVLTAAALVTLSGSQAPGLLSGVDMEQATRRLSQRFTGISINSLGVKALEKAYNRANFEFSTLEFNEIDAMLSNTSSANLINTITGLFDSLSTTNVTGPGPVPPDCCSVAAQSSPDCCFVCDRADQDQLANVSAGLSDSNLDQIQLYFGFREGTLVSSPTPRGNCTPSDARLQPWFIDATRSARPREVVLMLDFTPLPGITMETDFVRLRQAASFVLSSLTPLDKVGVVAVDMMPFAPPLFTGTRVVPVCQYIKDSLNGFVGVFQPSSTLTDYTASFNLAFNMFSNDGNTDKVIVLFSSGLLTVASDASAIVARHAELGGTAVVNSYLIYTPLAFFNSLAAALPAPLGRVTVLGQTDSLVHLVGDYYSQLLTALPTSSAITFGHQLDPSGVNSLTITRPFFDENDELVGVFHAMLPWNHLFGHITPSLVNRESSYFFVSRGDQQVLFHPLLPGNSQSDVRVTDVETDTALSALFSAVQSNRSSTHQMAATVEILLSHASDDFNAFVSRSLSATYYCRDVGVATGLRLQACFVLASEDAIVGSLDEGSVELGNFTAVDDGDLVYHHVVTGSDDQCNYFCKPSATDRVSYQLVTPSVPDEVDSPELVGQLFTYLASGLASDRPQGVEVGVATEVALGSVVVPHWINDASENNDYITRRHLATPNGVYLTYPPTQLVREFAPIRTEWYTASSTLPSSVILTPPYPNTLREGGHLSVSLGYSIRSPTDESDEDLSEGGRVLAVAAADLTLASLKLFVEEASPFCRSPNITCFIIDNVGNLVYHPALLEAEGELEGVPHFFARPLAAGDKALSANLAILYGMLMREEATPLQKLQCVDLFDTLVARRVFYALNLSFAEETFEYLALRQDATNLCAFYTLRRIPETNAFFAAVERRRDGNGQILDCTRNIICFCPDDPTSTCFNDNFQQNSCECPCVRNDNCLPIRNVPACPAISLEPPNLRAALGTVITDIIEANDHPPFCFNQQCDCHTDSSTCSAARECIWCEEQDHCVHITECCDSDSGISCCADSNRFDGLSETLGCFEVSCAQYSGTSPFNASACPTTPPPPPTTPPPPPPPLPTREPSRLSGGAITGIVVGVFAGLLILLSLAMLCIWYQFFRKADPQEETSRESAFDFSQKRMEGTNPRAIKKKGKKEKGGGSHSGGGGGGEGEGEKSSRDETITEESKVSSEDTTL